MKEKLRDFSLRLDTEDYKALTEQSKQLNQTKNAYLRNLIRLNSVNDIVQFNNNFKEFLLLRRSLTNSLNQLAKEGHNINNFEKIEKGLDELWQYLKR